MNKKHDDFYELIKDWTISDFHTPGIKAEVIVDMLISDFIADLLQYHYKRYDVVLLTKEFPIKLYEMNNRNAKVDYLVSIGDEKLILVELKTTNDSFIEEQRDRMKNAVNAGAEELLKFYKQIADLKTGNSSDRKKYKNIYRQYEEILSEAKLSGQTFEKVDYLYIFLTDCEVSEEKKLVLKNYCIGGDKYEEFCNWLKKGEKGEDRSQLWKQISDILQRCAKNPEE